MPGIAPGTVLTLHLATAPDLTGVTTAVGGRPILLDSRRVCPSGRQPLPRHPRTALGWNDDQFILAVVDGRQEDLSAGMTYPELASLMRRLGCEYALNLDGGGSSTLWLDGHVMNSPSDGRERPVANSLVVVSIEPNEIPGGFAEPMMSDAKKKAQAFLEQEKAFRLGALLTESLHPKTLRLSQTIQADIAAGVRMLQSVDEDIPAALERIFAQDSFGRLVEALHEAMRTGHRIYFTGCGATGRLSILLEAAWREFWRRIEAGRFPRWRTCASASWPAGISR